MKIKLLFLISLMSSIVLSQAPKGDRVIAYQIDLAENLNFDSAYFYAEKACMESIHFFSTWNNIDTNAANFDSTYIANTLDLANNFYTVKGIKVEYQLAPLNTNVETVPADLIGMDFDNPILISRFKQTLDTVFAHLNTVELTALNIGNEHDIILGTDPAKYEAYKVFLDSVVPYAKQLYFDLHGEELKVGTTFTMEGLIGPTKASLCKMVNDSLDIITTTYYPQSMTSGDESYTSINSHIDELFSVYSDTTKKLYFAECGYASSTYLGSSESEQATFFSNMFTVWDEHADRIKYLTVFKTTDWSDAQVAELALYYGISDSTFTEFLRTLGLRTWDGDGTNKLAYERILCELYVRDWCSTSCASLNMKEIDNEIPIYPNPSNGIIIIEGITVQSAELWNSTGQKVADYKHTNQLNLSHLTPGIYFLNFLDESGNTHSKKIVLN